MIKSSRKRFAAAAVAAGLLSVSLVACGSKDTATEDKAQAEISKAGEAAVDGSNKATEKAAAAADKAADAAKDAADAAKDAADKAGDAAKEAGKDVADAASDAGKKAADAAKDAADAAKDAASDAGDAAKDAAAKATEAAKDAASDVATGDMVKVTDAAGASVSVPKAINDEATKLGAATTGALVNVKHTGDKWVGSYANGWHIAYDKDHGAIPVKGKIGQVWFDGGNVTNPVGMPTAAEKTTADGNWVQSFTHGEIWANTDGTSGTKMN